MLSSDTVPLLLPWFQRPFYHLLNELNPVTVVSSAVSQLGLYHTLYTPPWPSSVLSLAGIVRINELGYPPIGLLSFFPSPPGHFSDDTSLPQTQAYAQLRVGVQFILFFCFLRQPATLQSRPFSASTLLSLIIPTYYITVIRSRILPKRLLTSPFFNLMVFLAQGHSLSSSLFPYNSGCSRLYRCKYRRLVTFCEYLLAGSRFSCRSPKIFPLIFRYQLYIKSCLSKHLFLWEF